MAQDRTNVGDSAVLESQIYEDDGVTPANPSDVTWLVNDPLDVPLIVSDLPVDPVENQVIVINQDIGLFDKWDTLQWDGLDWIQVGVAVSNITGHQATFILPPAAVNISGLYRGLARFTLPDNIVRSNSITFEAINLLESDTGSLLPEDKAVDVAWMMLEDLFDSKPGGPWLRDKTLAIFDKSKMRRLVPQAIYSINNEYQPITSFDETNFPYQQHAPLLSQALLVETIYHLIRSYTEQYTPAGSPISWFDRRDYVTRWQSVLTAEEAKFFRWLDLFKQSFLTFGHGSMLIGGYGSALTRVPKVLRTRYPRYVGPYSG